MEVRGGGSGRMGSERKKKWENGKEEEGKGEGEGEKGGRERIEMYRDSQAKLSSDVAHIPELFVHVELLVKGSQLLQHFPQLVQTILETEGEEEGRREGGGRALKGREVGNEGGRKREGGRKGMRVGGRRRVGGRE